MEKQLNFLQTDKKDDCQLWCKLPEKEREKIETIFAQLLVRYLSSTSEEVKEHEK